MKFLGFLRIQHLRQIILSPTDQIDDIDFVENDDTVDTDLIQYMGDKSLSVIIRDTSDNERKALKLLMEHHFSKGKQKVISLYTELTSSRRLKSESIRDYIIGAENISTALKEAGESIIDGHLIAMVLKRLPPNFNPFTRVMSQKKNPWLFLNLRYVQEVMK